MHCVLDCSAALAWVLPGAATDATNRLLTDIAEAGAVAPGLWPLEIANVLRASERPGRISLSDRTQATTTLAALPIQIDETHRCPRFWPDIRVGGRMGPDSPRCMQP